jgi:uncharacterized membrane protein YeaQ/YmgE (transglycosylase-associated protein family)
MFIQSWIILGLIAGALVGMLIGRSYGIVGDVILGIISGLVGGSLASILFVGAGAANPANAIIAITAFALAAILLVVKRVVIRPRTA